MKGKRISNRSLSHTKYLPRTPLSDYIFTLFHTQTNMPEQIDFI